MSPRAAPPSLGLTYAALVLGGALGVHRFMLGDRAVGLVYLATLGLCGAGVFLDVFFLPLLHRRAVLLHRLCGGGGNRRQ